MTKRRWLWATAVIASCFGVTILTPNRIGYEMWNALRLPVVVFTIVAWAGLVFSFIPKKANFSDDTAGTPEFDLSVAAPLNDTVVAKARLSTKVAVSVLSTATLSVAFWDGVLHSSHWMRAMIWLTAGFALALYLVKLLRRRIVFSPTTILWREHGHEIARRYSDVSDFRVVSRSEILVLFVDGQKLEITSDMIDVRKALATITSRRLADGR